MLDLSRCPFPPYRYQVTGIEKLVVQPVVGLFDSMGLGKSLQTIAAAQVLYTQGVIDKVLIICPAAVRGVWAHEEWGELRKHLWPDLPAVVTEYHVKLREWRQPGENPLRFIITNVDYIRSKARLFQLAPFCTPRTLLIVDEATTCKNAQAQQTKAVLQLRRLCGRVCLLSGTPITNSIGDLYSLGNILDPRILDCKYYSHFRARYAVMGGYKVNGRPVQIIRWDHVDDIQRRFQPVVLRRLKEGNLELPPKLAPVTLTTTLTPETWTLYKSMRADLVAWLSVSTVSVAAQAVTKIMRLQQITSGFLGGIEDSGLDDAPAHVEQTQAIGREKLDMILTWVAARIEEDPNFRLVIWCRFRPELQRLVAELSKAIKHVGAISGGQKTAERESALQLLDPRTVPNGPVVVVGNPASGGMGISLVAANTVMYASNSHSVMQRLQSEDRTARPGQTLPCSYFDVCAEGPAGQKTIDFAVLKAIREKNNLATWTSAAWVKALTEE